MKKALNLFGMYFLFFISGTIAIAIIYSFYINIQNYVAGSEIKFFSNVDMVNSLFTALYYMIILICPLVSYYRIRHPGGIWQFIFYVLICLITWVVLLPCLYFAEDFCYKRLPHQTKEVTLSKNYFRQLDNKIYYFIDDFNISEADSKNEETTAVIIDTDENGKVKYKNIKNDKLLDLIKKAAPYNELLVKETFSYDGIHLPVDVKAIIKAGRKNLKSGITYFAAFLSIGFIISSLYSLTSFFSWKLLNAVLLFFMTVIILVVNSLYYSSFFNKIIVRISDNGFFALLSKFTNDPFIFIVNCAFMLLFIIVGLVRFFVSLHRKNAI